MIMATEMKQHFEHLSKFDNSFNSRNLIHDETGSMVCRVGKMCLLCVVALDELQRYLAQILHSCIGQAPTYRNAIRVDKINGCEFMAEERQSGCFKNSTCCRSPAISKSSKFSGEWFPHCITAFLSKLILLFLCKIRLPTKVKIFRTFESDFRTLFFKHCLILILLGNNRNTV